MPLFLFLPPPKKILNPNIEILNGHELHYLVFRISCLVLSSGEGDKGGEVAKFPFSFIDECVKMSW